jgi:hypothetical protein
MSGRRDELIENLRDRYASVQYAYVQFLSEHLADCARSFRGDLTSVLVLAIVGQAHLSAYAQRGASHGERLSYGVQALRIADITGIPRETVRRKLAKLRDIGWILSGPDGWFLAGDGKSETQARTDLADLDARGIERLARLYDEIGRILASPPPQPTQIG